MSSHHGGPMSTYTGGGGPASTYAPSNYGGGQTQTHERKVSSVVIQEEYLQGHPPPAPDVRYVEVPIVEEIIRQVPRREIIEVPKHVPKIEYKYVDKIIEVPQIEYIDRIVEVPKVQEEVRYVHKTEVVDVPREVIEHIPRIETRIVEKIVDVPGQIVEVPKPYKVEKIVEVPNYIMEEYPVVLSQTIRPQFVQSSEKIPVQTFEHEAEVIEVVVPVAKIVDLPIRSKGVVDESYHSIAIPTAEYNSMLRALNPHIAYDQNLPYRRENGIVTESKSPLRPVPFLGPLHKSHALEYSSQVSQYYSPSAQASYHRSPYAFAPKYPKDDSSIFYNAYGSQYQLHQSGSQTGILSTTPGPSSFPAYENVHRDLVQNGKSSRRSNRKAR